MSQFPIPRGTARAIRRGNVAPSLGFIPFVYDEQVDGTTDSAEEWASIAHDESRLRYRDLREEGYSHHQAMLMSWRGDPDT